MESWQTGSVPGRPILTSPPVPPILISWKKSAGAKGETCPNSYGDDVLHANAKDIDFIVVGTGPGGATVAKELSQRNKKVLILEWGDNKPLVGSFWQGAKGMLIPGRSLLFTNQMLGLIRGITTGGSTVYYYATSWPVPLEMLKSHGVDITKEVEETRKELPIAPLKNEMMGPMATRIMESAQDLGYNWQKLDKFMYQDRWKPEYPFGHYGDPFGVKWSARMYVEEALKNGAKLITGAKATRAIIENKIAVGVEYQKNRKIHRVFAPKQYYPAAESAHRSFCVPAV